MVTIGPFPDDDEDNDDDEEDDDDESAADDEIATDEEAVSTVDDGPSSAKKIKLQDQSGEDSDKIDKGCTGADGDTSHMGDDEEDGQSDALPDLPQPKPVIKRGPSDFSAQEHIFLAWAKTMSTFTAKRQATIKMQINKIMSEAEFEDLDDEFFAGYFININLICIHIIYLLIQRTTYFYVPTFEHLTSCPFLGKCSGVPIMPYFYTI